MGTHTQDYYRGLILRDSRFSTANATISPASQQAGPVVGEPVVTDGEGFMDLEAVGTSTADRAYDVQAVKPGNAKGTDTGGRFAWRLQTENVSSWRGWMPYSFMANAAVYAVETTATIAVAWPHAITTKDEYVHLAYSEVTGAGTPSGAVKVATLNPSTDAWTVVNVSTSSYGPVTILELPSSRLLVLVSDTSGVTVDSYYSDDRGATWAKAQAHSDSSSENYGIVTPDSGTTVAVVHFQAVYHNGYITLIRQVKGTAYEVDHYVSEDMGATFTLVERFQPDLGSTTGSGTSVVDVYDPRLVVDANGGVKMYYADASALGVNRQIRWTRKAAPYAKFADHPELDSRPPLPSGDYDSQGRFVVCTDSEGFVALVHQRTQNTSTDQTGQAYIQRSTHATPDTAITDARGIGQFFTMSDTGTSATQWSILDQTGETGGSWAAKTIEINRSTITPYKDGLLLITGSYSTEEGGVQSSPGRGSCMQIHLGGTSNYDLVDNPTDFQYLPLDTPDNVAAGFSNLGAVALGGSARNTTFTIETAGCKFATTSGGSHAFSYNATASILYARVQGGTNATVSAGNITGNYGTLAIGDVEVRFAKDKAQVWDNTPGYASSVAISAILDLSDEQREWCITYSDEGANPDQAWVMYKKPFEQVWTKVTTTAGLTGTRATNEAIFGNYVAGTYTNWFHNVQIGSPARADSRDWTNTSYHPKYLYGRPFSVYATYLDAGWQLESKGSAAFVDDTWQASTGYEYPVKAVHPETAASPRIEWRSLDDDTEITIQWIPDSGTTTRPLSPAIGLHLSAINFKTAYFEGYDGSSWATLGIVNTATDFASLKYSLSGNIVRPQGSGTYGAARFVMLEELVDSYAVFDAGGGSESVHKILHSAEGSFSASSGTVHAKPAELVVGGSLGSVSATGNFEIREHQATLLMFDKTTGYQRYRLRIPAQKTAEGYFKIGACVVGPVLVFGQDYSWGRTVAHEANQEITTGRSGDRMVEELGPIRRQVQFAWGEGWDATKTQGASPTDFDVVNLGAANAAGVRNDPSVMAGAIRRLSGAKEPAVYLPRIKHEANQVAQMVLGRERNIYGRVVSPVTQTTVLGDEGTDEVITINQIVIDEEV
jgi:hypothetical protein